MLKLELVEESPGVTQVWLDLYRAQEPLSGFRYLSLAPEQSAGYTNTSMV